MNKVVAWGASGFMVVATLVWLSGPDMFFGSMLLLVLVGWGALGLLGVTAFVRAARSRPEGWLHDWAPAWVGCAAALVASVALGVTGAPEGARIALSRSALIDAGEKVLAGEHPCRAGLYGLGRTQVSGGCALLQIGTAFIDSLGFAYCPTGSSGRFDDDLGGGLYTFSFD